MSKNNRTFTDEWPTAQFKRKSTKRWCKGKVGREHLPTVAIDKYFASINENSGSPLCHIPTEEELKNCPGKFYYCSHQVECSTCGKVLEMRPKACPTTGLILN